VAAARQVDREVLPKIDELQGGADRVALAQRRIALHAKQVQHQPAHRVGRAPAVVLQLRPVGIALAIPGASHVLLEGREQVQQVGRWQCVAGYGLAKGPEDPGPAGV
jgi:hypothetical protein